MGWTLGQMKGVRALCLEDGWWWWWGGLKLNVFRLLLFLDGPKIWESELHADTSQPAIKQIKYNTQTNTDKKTARWDIQTANCSLIRLVVLSCIPVC